LELEISKIIDKKEVMRIRELLRVTDFDTQQNLTYETKLKCSDGTIIDVEVLDRPIKFNGLNAIISVIRDISKQKKLFDLLKSVTGQSKGLKDYIPICASCYLIRDDEKDGKPWVKPADYISERLPEVNFSHTICPECMVKLYPELKISKQKE
jgi:hypothetical protein